MKKLTFLFLMPALVLVLASPVLADTLDFTATSSLGGTPFTVTFSEPSTISDLTTTTAATLTSLGFAFTDPNAIVTFYAISDMGLFNVDMNYGGTDLLFEFFGPQIFTGDGPFQLLTGTFPLGFEGQPGFFSASNTSDFDGDETQCNGNFYPIGDGQVVVTTGNTPAPEPGSFALLGAGLAGLAAFRRKFQKA